ncbi:MAG: peptidylprolyl isomerase, partial [Muribaculaceae bacterium]|nr:peptidylprolyl isomerase [Muribaculaceae bacterium]
KAVASLQPGEISQPFIMRDPKRDREIVAMVKLTTRIDAHQANMADDYQLIKDMYEQSQSEKIVERWLQKKINETYVRIEDGWRGCDFRHQGWIKNR